jgi:hypothetical protein
MNVLLVPLTMAGIFTAGFAMNEVSHGGVAEMMGAGHHHVVDMGGAHCADHGDPEHADHHAEHMHGNATALPHDECPGGEAMHGRMMG